MNLSEHTKRFEKELRKAVRIESFRFLRWAHKKGYRYHDRQWRKIGGQGSLTEPQIWEAYEKATSRTKP